MSETVIAPPSLEPEVVDEFEFEEEEEEESVEKDPVEEIRSSMRDMEVVDSPLKAYIIPYHDEHSNEYLPESNKRLKFLTGFSGLAGTAVITETESKLWTDPRFFELAEKELYPGWELMKSGLPSFPNEMDWLKAHIPEGSLVGADPKVFPYPVWITIKDGLKANGLKFTPVKTNLVDHVWTDKPSVPNNKVIIVPEIHSGMKSSQKVAKVRSEMKHTDMLVISGLDDIAWLLNLRGTDVPLNPLFFAFLAITKKNVHLFINEYKITDKVKNHFQREGLPLRLHPYENFYSFVNEIVRADKAKIEKVWIPSITSFAIYSSIPNDKHFLECSPIQILKAVKTPAEVEGMMNANIRDGIALCNFFHWIETNKETSELEASGKLEHFQKCEDLYFGPSVKTMFGSGPNSSNPYYTPNIDSRYLTQEDICLVESGGHYYDGTTDMARTFHLGAPKEFEMECYTRVLKGLIYLSNCVFPPGVNGYVLDCLARKHLWSVGLDYGHGSGHGVGCFLNLHEGPMGISWRAYPDDPGLSTNMFLSNTPGYYHNEEGNQFGIRIGNIVQVVESEAPFRYQNRTFLKFNTISLCPIDTKMISIELLTPTEVDFLNVYHNKVHETLGPVLKQRGLLSVYEWLAKATTPIVFVPRPPVTSEDQLDT